jgi:hypothetical protein
MATPQQTPQQPIYPRDLNLALDRNFTKFTTYTDSRFEALAAQMRIANEESIIRDTDLANAILRLTERVSKIENTQVNVLKTLGEIQQQIADGFAAQAERHNELMARVGKLESSGQN